MKRSRLIPGILLLVMLSVTSSIFGTYQPRIIEIERSKPRVMRRKADKEIVVPMTVDVDGAPTSYGPDDRKALDYELNAHVGAKKSGAIVGYLVDKHGKPI